MTVIVYSEPFFSELSGWPYIFVPLEWSELPGISRKWQCPIIQWVFKVRKLAFCYHILHAISMGADIVVCNQMVRQIHLMINRGRISYIWHGSDTVMTIHFVWKFSASIRGFVVLQKCFSFKNWVNLIISFNYRNVWYYRRLHQKTSYAKMNEYRL